MKKQLDVPGNARESALAVQRVLLRLAEQLVRADRTFERLAEEELEVVGMSVKLPEYAGGDYLVTVRAFKGGVAVVAFHGSDQFADVVRGAIARLENGSMRWRDDNYRDDDGK